MSKLDTARREAAGRTMAADLAADAGRKIGAAAARKERREGAAETSAVLQSNRTGRPVTWHRTIRRPDGTSYSVPMTADAGSYSPRSLVRLANDAARLAGSRFKRADLADLAADLVTEVLAKCEPGRLPQRGTLGADERITDPRERDRAYLVGMARHRLADEARAGGAEVESLDAALTLRGDSLTVADLTERAEAQAHSDPGLVNPDANPVTRDSWGAVEHFPTRDAGRAALADLIGTRATRADLARAAGLANPKDWHRSCKRGRPVLARLAEEPVSRWTDRDWRTVEAWANLIAAEGPDGRGLTIADLMARPGTSIYRPPTHDRPWRTQPDEDAPVTITNPRGRA